MPSERRPHRGRRAAGWAAAAAVATVPLVWVINHLTPRPAGLGTPDGRLAACPESPNCVHSQATDPRHRVPPLPFAGPPEAALQRLKEQLAQTPGTRLVEEDDLYLAYEFRSRLWRFVDDVEFLADATAQVIHVRSASRIGYSDLGANRRRIEAIRRGFVRP